MLISARAGSFRPPASIRTRARWRRRSAPDPARRDAGAAGRHGSHSRRRLSRNRHARPLGHRTAPITFTAYNNERHRSGADLVTGWSNASGSVFNAPQYVGPRPGNNQVFVNGHMMTEARWPNTSLDVSHQTFAHAQRRATTAATTTHS